LPRGPDFRTASTCCGVSLVRSGIVITRCGSEHSTHVIDPLRTRKNTVWDHARGAKGIRTTQ
jgi:hypothetical protein